MIATALALIAPLLGGVGGLAAIGLGGIPYLGPLLKFLTGPGKPVGIALLVGMVWLHGFWKGDAHGDAQCVVKIEGVNKTWSERVDRAAEDFARERERRDSKIASDIDGEVARQTAALQEREAAAQKEIQRYEEELRKRGGACRLGPADRVQSR